MKAKVIGHMNVPTVAKRKRHYQKPLKVSMANALRIAFRKRGKSKENEKC